MRLAGEAVGSRFCSHRADCQRCQCLCQEDSRLPWSPAEQPLVLRLDRPSVHTLHVNLEEAMREDSDQQRDLIRISGNRWSGFSESTFVGAVLPDAWQPLT